MPKREWDADLREPTKEFATTAREAGLEIGIHHPNRVRAWLKDDPERLMQGERIKLAALYEYALEKKEKLDGAGAGEEREQNVWRTKKLQFQAEREEIELERLRGNLVEVQRAVRLVETILRPFANTMQDIPRRVAGELVNRSEAEIEATLRQRIDDAVVEFENGLRALPSSMADGEAGGAAGPTPGAKRGRGRPRKGA